MSDEESIAGREREVIFHIQGALTREQVEEYGRNLSAGQFHTTATFLLDHDAALRGTITQQAQELEESQLRRSETVAMCEQLQQQLATMTSAVNFLYESKETLLQAFCNLQETYGEQKHEIRNLKATLAAREAELNTLARSHDTMLNRLGEAEKDLYTAIHNRGGDNGMWGKWCARLLNQRDAAVQALARLQLTWTTARPTVAGRYWYKDLDGAHILMVERVHHTDLCVSYEGSLTPLNEYHGEWAGPIPLPTEAQQARGSSGMCY